MSIDLDKYIPKYHGKQEFFKEIKTLLDYTISFSEEDAKDIYGKYTDTIDLEFGPLSELIRESGYEYIIDFLESSPEETKSIAGFLNLISMLKGTKKGLLLIFRLIGVNIELIQWWEKEFPDEPYTFDIEINLLENDSELISDLSKIRAFVRHYVYPVLKRIIFYYIMHTETAVSMTSGFVDKSVGGTVETEAPVLVDSELDYLISSNGSLIFRS